jgi:hypothetical protein
MCGLGLVFLKTYYVMPEILADYNIALDTNRVIPRNDAESIRIVSIGCYY